jgi:hypothetical protein
MFHILDECMNMLMTEEHYYYNLSPRSGLVDPLATTDGDGGICTLAATTNHVMHRSNLRSSEARELLALVIVRTESSLLARRPCSRADILCTGGGGGGAAPAKVNEESFRQESMHANLPRVRRDVCK